MTVLPPFNVNWDDDDYRTAVGVIIVLIFYTSVMASLVYAMFTDDETPS